MLLFSLSNCCKEEPVCECVSPEICVNDQCELPENTFKVGSVVFTGNNLYLGSAATNCICVETLLIDIDENEEFSLLYTVDNGQGSSINGLSIINKISENEYRFLTNRLCPSVMGGLQAEVSATIFPDSINSTFYFYVPNEVPRTFIDSCAITFYK